MTTGTVDKKISAETSMMSQAESEGRFVLIVPLHQRHFDLKFIIHAHNDSLLESRFTGLR